MPIPNYNYYFPQGYQPQNNFMTQQQSQQQMQNGGFVNAPNEAYVVNYPVAPGNCVSFKIEGQPIVLEKSMGFSQFDTPRIERFRLVKEEVVTEASQMPQKSINTPNPINSIEYVQKPEFEAFKKEFEAFKDNFYKKEVDDE